MRFVITGGGTAGHINPALATAQELSTLGHEVLYAGRTESMESEQVPRAGFEFKAFEASGFNRSRPHTLVSSTLKIANSSKKAKKWLLEVAPDAVIGFGGYVSIPVGLAASRLGIPLAIHEQNSTVGLANKFLSKRADLVALTYRSAKAALKTKGQIVLIGNPVRAALFDVDTKAAKKHFGFLEDSSVLLVFGGSLGAKHINEAIITNFDKLMEVANLSVLQVSGKRDFEAASTGLRAHRVDERRWKLLDYCDVMGQAYAAADVVLSRAGATTLAELAALAKPSLLVPYPFAAADEQTTNAAALVNIGGADMIADSELDSPVFTDKLLRLITDDTYRQNMQHQLKNSPTLKARSEFAKLIVKLASKN